MKTLRSAATLFAVAALLLGGCATTKQARGVDEKDGVLLDDYSILREGKGGEALRVYTAEQMHLDTYNEVLIEAIVFPAPEGATEEELADLQKLANNLYVNLVTQLGSDYKVVKTPGPFTLRVQTAFFNAKKKRMVSNTLSSIMPPGMAVSLVKDFATGKPMGVGEITGEAKVTDALSGVLLAAALDRRVGQKYSKGTFTSWAEANDAMEFWAKRMRFAVCQGAGRAQCVAP